MNVSDAKDPSEIIDASFEFVDDLAGEAIAAASAIVTIAVAVGVDADVANMLQGGPSIAGTVVFQRVRNGVDKVDYRLRCTITTSSGRKLVLPLQMPVRTL
jgi:hypothetical protein